MRLRHCLLALLYIPWACAAPLPAVADGPIQVAPGDLFFSAEGASCKPGGVYVLHDGALNVFPNLPLASPRGLAFDRQGDLLVTNVGGGVFRIHWPTQEAIALTPPGQPPLDPRDLALDSKGDLIVVDWPEPRGATAPVGGAFPTPTPGGSAGLYRVTPLGAVTPVLVGPPLAEPHGIAIDHDGNYVVADRTAGIVRITPSGSPTVVYPSTFDPERARQWLHDDPRLDTSILVGPSSIAIDAAGNYVVADVIGSQLLRVSPSGQATVIHHGPPFTINSVRLPYGAANGLRAVKVAPDGNYLVVDDTAKQLFTVAPDGRVISAQPLNLCSPAEVLPYHGQPFTYRPPIPLASARPAPTGSTEVLDATTQPPADPASTSPSVASGFPWLAAIPLAIGLPVAGMLFFLATRASRR